MRTRQEVDQVLALRAEGLNGCEIARRTGIPRGTVKGWLTGHAPDFDRSRAPHGRPLRICPVCRGDPRGPAANGVHLPARALPR